MITHASTLTSREAFLLETCRTIDNISGEAPNFDRISSTAHKHYFDIDRVCSAIFRLSQEMEALRIGYEYQPELVRCVHDKLPPESYITVIDERNPIKRKKLFRDFCAQPLAVDEAPLFRLAIFRINLSWNIIVTKSSHIVVDGFSNQIISRLFSEYYFGLRKEVEDEQKSRIQSLNGPSLESIATSQQKIKNRSGYGQRVLDQSKRLKFYSRSFEKQWRPELYKSTSPSIERLEIESLANTRIIKKPYSDASFALSSVFAVCFAWLAKTRRVGFSQAYNNRTPRMQNLCGFISTDIYLTFEIHENWRYEQLALAYGTALIEGMACADLDPADVIEGVSEFKNVTAAKYHLNPVEFPDLHQANRIRTISFQAYDPIPYTDLAITYSFEGGGATLSIMAADEQVDGRTPALIGKALKILSENLLKSGQTIGDCLRILDVRLSN